MVLRLRALVYGRDSGIRCVRLSPLFSDRQGIRWKAKDYDDDGKRGEWTIEGRYRTGLVNSFYRGRWHCTGFACDVIHLVQLSRRSQWEFGLSPILFGLRYEQESGGVENQATFLCTRPMFETSFLSSESANFVRTTVVGRLFMMAIATR